MQIQTPIRVACVGAGYFSQFQYKAWARIDDVKLVASVNRSLESAKATGLPAFDELAAMLLDVRPDLVDIITPPVTHLPYIKTCIEHDIKTVICQKPFCENLEQAREAVRLAKEADITLVIHENFRFQPWFREMKQALNNGLVGTVHQATFRARTGDGQGPNAYMDRQPYFQKMERFFIHETGVHWVDTFRYLLGDPVSVYADLRKMNPVIAGEDAAHVILEFDNGVRAVIDANRHLDHNSENCRKTFGESLLEGTNGTISLLGSGEVQFRPFGSQVQQTLLAAEEYEGFAGDCVFAFQSHVIAAMRGYAELENTASDYLKILEIEDAIYHSAATGQRVQL